jgi:hypothetical protein
MDAKVHPARPVHRNAEETIDLVRRDLRRQRADESVDQVADHHLGVVARRSFRAQFQARDRGFRPSALADAAQAALQAHSTKQRLVASADRVRVAPIVVVEKVVGHPAQAHLVEEHSEAAHLGGAAALQTEVQRLGAEMWEQRLPE